MGVRLSPARPALTVTSTPRSSWLHLIPLELGGDGYAAGNLWPEPYASAGAPVKDQLENRLRLLVCDGRQGLRVVQEAIAANWYAAYQRYVSAST
jgi:hypothetical protein